MTQLTDGDISTISQKPYANTAQRKTAIPATEYLRTYGIVLALLLLVGMVEIADPSFLSRANIVNMLGQWALTGVMAVGMTFVIIAGGFDLSIASGFSLCAIVAALLGADGWPLWVALVAAVATGLVIGGVNGGLVSVLGINPFIATVGTGFIILGIDFLATPNTYIQVTQPGFDLAGRGDVAVFPLQGDDLAGLPVAGRGHSRQDRLRSPSLCGRGQRDGLQVERPAGRLDYRQHLCRLRAMHGSCRQLGRVAAQHRAGAHGADHRL